MAAKKETKFSKWWWGIIVACFLVVGFVDWTNYDYNTSLCKEKGYLTYIETLYKEDLCNPQDTPASQGERQANNNKK